jgi:hypothetical protein
VLNKLLIFVDVVGVVGVQDVRRAESRRLLSGCVAVHKAVKRWVVFGLLELHL